MQSIEPKIEGAGIVANNFSLLDLYLTNKALSVKIRLLNIFKDHHIVAKLSAIAVDYDE